MNILDNELVKKYFGDIQDWGPGEPVAGIITHGCSAQKILRAMQEPIKPGDLVLERFPSNTENEWQETRWPDNQGVDSWHSAFLRLPDKFQKKCCDYAKYKEKFTDGSFIQLCEDHYKKLTEAIKPIQKRECTCVCRFTGAHCSCKICHQPQREAVEEKIHFIKKRRYINEATEEALEMYLRELVRLVEEEK